MGRWMVRPSTFSMRQLPTPSWSALVKSFMDEHGLSNSLWASAQFKEVASDVLEAVPAIVAQIFERANDMIPQALSNCLWAFAQLKDEVPKVVKMIPDIVGEIWLAVIEQRGGPCPSSRFSP